MSTVPASPGSSLGAVIFDMDGVLIDNSPFYTAAWQRFIEEQRPRLPPGREPPSEPGFGRRNAELLTELFSSAAGATIPATTLEALSRRMEEIYLELYLPHMTEMPGLSDCLRRARAGGLRLALATSAPAANVPIVLERLGLQSAFAVVLTEADVTRGKPDPQIYLHAAAGLGLPPADCLVFEDSLAGVAAARAAGCACVALTTTYAPERLAAAGAQLLIRDFRDPALWAWLGWP